MPRSSYCSDPVDEVVAILAPDAPKARRREAKEWLRWLNVRTRSLGKTDTPESRAAIVWIYLQRVKYNQRSTSKLSQVLGRMKQAQWNQLEETLTHYLVSRGEASETRATLARRLQGVPIPTFAAVPEESNEDKNRRLWQDLSLRLELTSDFQRMETVATTVWEQLSNREKYATTLAAVTWAILHQVSREQLVRVCPQITVGDTRRVWPFVQEKVKATVGTKNKDTVRRSPREKKQVDEIEEIALSLPLAGGGVELPIGTGKLTEEEVCSTRQKALEWQKKVLCQTCGLEVNPNVRPTPDALREAADRVLRKHKLM